VKASRIRALALGSLLLLTAACGRLGFAFTGQSSDAGSMQPTEAGTIEASTNPWPSDADAWDDDAGFFGVLDGTGCKNLNATDYCSEIPELKSEPKIDGHQECGPTLLPLSPRGWTSDSALPTDQSASIAVAWRPNGLYVYVQVKDPLRIASIGSPWCGDAAEIYLDADGTTKHPAQYDSPGAIQLIAAAPAQDGASSETGDQRYRAPIKNPVGRWSSPRHGIFATEDGYVLEALVTAEDLDLPALMFKRGTSIGFDIGINVSVGTASANGDEQDCPKRLGQYFLRVWDGPCTGESCRPYLDTRAFCKPKLR
jgi:hypothetical protein